MEPETKSRIEKAVLDILKSADMESMTEYNVRSMAADNLGLDLSSPDYKRFIRGVVESFLLEKQSLSDAPAAAGCGDEDDKTAADAESEPEPEVASGGGGKREYDDDGDLVICRLSNKRRVTIQEFRGKTLVSIREYYERDGKQLPSAKGISLNTEQWEAFSKAVPAIEEAIKKLEGK